MLGVGAVRGGECICQLLLYARQASSPAPSYADERAIEAGCRAKIMANWYAIALGAI
jgi:hypothetical protein